MDKNKKIILALVGTIALLLLCCAIFVVLVFVLPRFLPETPAEPPVYDEPVDVFEDLLDDYEEEDYDDPASDDDASSDTSEEAEEAAEEEGTGTISGSVSYPSEFIPDALTVCAEDSVSSETLCTDNIYEDDSFTYKYGYSLEVPPGSYYVYAYNPDNDPDYKAFYSEFVTCGLSVDCPSHDPILVSIASGEVAIGIDPGDWYAPE